MRLRPDVHVTVGVDDRSQFGSPLGSRPEETARRAFAPVVERYHADGLAGLGRDAEVLLARSRAGAAFAEVTVPANGGWTVREHVRFPDPSAAGHRQLTLSRGARVLDIAVPSGGWADLHDLLAGPDLAGPWERVLRDRGLVTDADPPEIVDGQLLFVGHNTVVVRAGGSAVVIDPFLRPSGGPWPSEYQPLEAAQIGPVDAICLTHSHPDHFDPSSLLRFPRHTLIVVPELERETILAVDLCRRLRELGFDNVQALPWWRSTAAGCLTVTALPFYGEQPTDGEVLHPEIRNAGNTFVVQAPEWSAAFLADAGRDGLGDIRAVATRWREEHGRVDIVFGGYRGWTTYPAALVGSSVGRYVLFVPPSQWPVRQRLMNDAEDLVDTAERFGASWVVPCAAGGAPWHWSIGLGPRLDGGGVEDPDFDPYPERVSEAAVRRSGGGDGIASGRRASVLPLHPGDAVHGLPHAPRVVRTPGHAWPW